MSGVEALDPRAIAARIERGTRVVVVGASDGGHLAFVLARLKRALEQRGDRRRLVVVVPEATRAGLLEDGLGFFLGSGSVVRVFSALDHLPFQGMSPSRLQVLDRMGVLGRLAARSETATAGGAAQAGTALDLLIVPAVTLLERLPPPSLFTTHRIALRVGDAIDREALIGFLVATGHHRVPSVEDMGTFAVRGEILDVWSTLGEGPVRVELFGDEIERLRAFDPTSQETLTPLEVVTFAPARDVVLDASAMPEVKRALMSLADQCHVPTSRTRAVVSDLEAGVMPPGLEELLPVFHPELATLFDHVGTDAIVVVVDPPRVHEVMAARYEELATRNARALAKRGELTFPVEALFLTDTAAWEDLTRRAGVVLAGFFAPEDEQHARFSAHAESMRELRRALEIAVQTGVEHPLMPLVERVRRWREEGAAVIVLAHTPGGIERVRSLLSGYPLSLAVHESGTPASTDPMRLAALRGEDADLHLMIGTPGEGFAAVDLGLVIIDEAEILGRPARPRGRKKKPPADALLKSWRDLKPGDLVVHLSHGIGRYQGLRKIPLSDGLEAEVLEIAYAGDGTLMVPVDKLHLVSKHQGGDAAPALDKLGGTGQAAWQKTKSRVKKAVRDIADQLLKIYAEREAMKGFGYSPPDEMYHRFEAAFPYEETSDQLGAIEEVLRDLVRERPMDRLVCGDVGFGKTEVAMRAAMKVVADGRQVAVLVPTQVLAEQHRLSFERRFEGFPVRVESLSSMKSSLRQKEVAAAVQSGAIDIIIGTHRLLSKDVKFKDLGLLVIDEEHRFGVAQKEHMKRLRANIDVLTLTATPIPRTLHMSMLGLRDISLIQTPPVDRLPIQTFVSQPTEETITEAIRRELARGGQVFFIHHRVMDIDKEAELIGALVPEARIVVGHGQMGDGQLEKVMLKFVTGEANVLVATTIVESGIDISNANTILINRADCFGLAQLYQLRGRVGRSGNRAYCYLLVPSPHALAGDAAERLGAIQRFSELGSGYSVASYDLDIRGTGDLLGADQAGNIDAIGYDTYMELLQQAIGELRASASGKALEVELDCELK
ncbi:MAG: transcription-repair coupling factor, partial [Deltaproteobacteria bacterium]|nr:transcription-repair coupling factor [Deltaproteobacteria bacterium]